VSCLCVTENRDPFIPWLLWSFERQTLRSKELIVIDSSERPLETARTDVRVVSVPPGTGIAAKRNRALSEARGAYVAWFDDDDWQHPERLERLCDPLQRGALNVAGCTSAWFLDLWKGRCAPYHPTGTLIFNSCVVRAELAKTLVFDERQLRASDTPWMGRLWRAAGRRATTVPRTTYTTWLCHDTNVSNPRSQRRCVLPLSLLEQTVGSRAWGDTDEQLERLRERLSSHRTPENLAT
jgi:glycosyltransferase involved in cell wall biosynthesis